MNPPTVTAHSFLTLHYRLSVQGEAQGNSDVINTFAGQPATLSLGTGELAPELEAKLVGLSEGAHETFEIPAGVAFGQRNPDLIQRVSMALLREHGDPDEEYKEGDVVQFPTPDGQGKFAGIVLAMGPKEEDWAMFDFNHPLAHQPLRFEVQIIGVL